jgi:caa(3)-type oxidase subunit IV
MAEGLAEVQSTQEATAHTAHPSPNYVLIFVWLIVITAVEVGVGVIPRDIIPNTITFPVLLAMAGAKAILVALYYMHLRYDNKWFSMLIMAALPLAVVFILALVLGFARK